MTEWDAPNQQVVRADHSAPWDEGTGGTGAPGARPTVYEAGSLNLDEASKDELLDYARSIGAKPANAAMNKDELRDSIDEAEGR